MLCAFNPTCILKLKGGDTDTRDPYIADIFLFCSCFKCMWKCAQARKISGSENSWFKSVSWCGARR